MGEWGVGCRVWGVGCGVWGVGCGVYWKISQVTLFENTCRQFPSMVN
ncbi:MAG: hypothetical protein O9350_03095 [Microcystis sp. LE19-388.1G]|nr:hypothetical protein [Microcystis sp. LE19-388.1G]